MSTYALLGATGSVGGQVLSQILQHTSHKVHCYVRSREKLITQLSDSKGLEIESRISIFEGQLSNADRLEKCLRGTDVAFLCAAASKNAPECRIAQDQAEAVVKALRNTRSKDSHARIPKLVVLSSAETEHKFNRDYPWVARTMLFNANYFIYVDLIEAEKYLRGHADFVTSIFMKPGGLSDDIARGHVVSEDKQQTFLSYADLVAGMVEVADVATEGDRWDGKVLSVLSPRGKAKFPWSNVPLLLRGLLVYFLPWTYSYVG